MKVLITGSRDWSHDHIEIIFRELSKLPLDTIIIHGACRGVDQIAGLIAKELGFVVKEYPARWDVFGRAAGMIRNQTMIDVEHVEHEPIDLVIAFHENIDNSKGTAGMVSLARRAKLNIVLISN